MEEKMLQRLGQLASRLRLVIRVSVTSTILLLRSHKRVLRAVLPVLLVLCLPVAGFSNVNVSLSWTANSDPSVTGYNIYASTDNQTYSETASVGAVSSMVIPNVPQNTVYFFAAKAHNQSGLESAFSNPTAFLGVSGTPQTAFNIKALPKNYTADQLYFSLDASAPPGATINPTNGTISWIPGPGYSSTTNYINVIVTDSNNPAMNISETVAISITDFLFFNVGSASVPSGGATKLPLIVSSSSTITNLQIILNWPGNQLVNPTLTFYSPVVSGSLQKLNGQLVVQLQTAPNNPLIGTNLVGQINFQAVSGMSSSIYSIPMSTAAGSMANGANYNNIVAPPGEVVVVGSSPLLRTQLTTNGGRSLKVYANSGTYQLQYTTSLNSPVVWTTLSTYAQTNLTQITALNSTNASIFYRLHQL
jgi:hypothetical protein